MSHDKMTGEALLQVRGLKKHFGHLEVLNGIDIDIHKGEVVASSALPVPAKVRLSAV